MSLATLNSLYNYQGCTACSALVTRGALKPRAFRAVLSDRVRGREEEGDREKGGIVEFH